MQKHLVISDALRLEIAEGRFGTDGRLPSESQLVQRFHVSRPTAARALLSLQQEGLIERKAGAGSFVRNHEQTQKNQLIGLLVPGRGSTEVLDVICGEIGATARLHGYGVLWGRSPHPMLDRDLNAALAREACELFIQRGVRGVIFAPFEHLDDSRSVNLELLNLLRQAGISVVLIDRDVMTFPLRSDYDLIALDNIQAGFLAADHLLRLGCRKLRLLTPTDAASSVDARMAGIREAHASCRSSMPRQMKIEGSPSDVDFVRSILRSKSPDAIICANDLTASQLLQTLADLQISVPADLRIVGFDDVRYATLTPTRLTTVRQPGREIAAVAFQTLEDRIQHSAIPARTILLAPTLVVRDSCGAYRGAAGHKP